MADISETYDDLRTRPGLAESTEFLCAAEHFADVLIERDARPHPGAGPRPPPEAFVSLEATEGYLLAMANMPPAFARDAAPLLFWTYRLIQARKAVLTAQG
jgi:hypothetical protein